VIILENKIKIIRIFYLILILIITLVSVFNVYFTTRTPFSGTTYLPLPSNIYINEDIELLDNNNNPTPIKKGAFLISVNDNYLDEDNFLNDSISGLTKFNKIIDNAPDTSIVKILFKDYNDFKNEHINKYYFRDYAQEFKISKSQLSKLNFKYLKDGIFLGYIIEDGATFRAGIRSGDILMNVNGIKWEVKFYDDAQSYMLTPESLKMLRSHPIGEPIYYNILRDGLVKSYQVRLAAFGLPITVLFTIILQFTFLIIGSILVFRNTKHLGSVLVGSWLILMAFNVAVGYSMLMPTISIYNTIIVYLRIILPIIYFPIILLSFVAFPFANQKIMGNKWIIGGLFLPYVLLLLFTSIEYFFQIGILNELYYLILLGIGILYFGIILIIFRKYEPKENKRASFIQYFSFILIIATNSFGMYQKNEYFQIIHVVIPFLYLFLIFRFGINKTVFSFRRTTQYSFITAIWHILLIFSSLIIVVYLSSIEINLPSVAISGANIEIVPNPEFNSQNTPIVKIIFAAISVLITIFAIRFGNIGQDYLNRKFYRQQFDYRLIQRELAYLIQTKFTLSDLAVVIVDKIKELVHLKNVGIIFYKTTNNSKDIYCYESTKGRDICLNLSQEIYDLIKVNNEVIEINKLSSDVQKIFIEKNYHYIFPLKSKTQLFGALLVGEKLSEMEHKREDFDFIYSMSSNFAMAIENTFLYEELAQKERLKHELDIARRIQLSSLPREIPKIDKLDISAYSNPALEVGGDFYDFYLNENKFNLVVGDVSGKGTSAALYMSKLQGILRTLNEFVHNPKSLMQKSNSLIYKSIESTSYITAVACSFDLSNNELNVVRAGHLPIYKINKFDSKLEILKPKGIGIGLSNDETFKKNTELLTLNYSQGDYFIFISDGVTDSRNKEGEDFDTFRLENLLKDGQYNNSQELSDLIINSITTFSDGVTQFDDITIVVVRIK